MTTYAACADNMGAACCRVEGDGLVAAIQARRVAASATHAALSVDLGIDHRLAVEVGGRDEVG